MTVKIEEQLKEEIKILQARITELEESELRNRPAEEALRKSEERFRRIAETTGEFIWETDAKGLYTYASSSVEKILGYKPEEIVGKKYFYDLFVPAERERLKREA